MPIKIFQLFHITLAGIWQVVRHAWCLEVWVTTGIKYLLTRDDLLIKEQVCSAPALTLLLIYVTLFQINWPKMHSVCACRDLKSSLLSHKSLFHSVNWYFLAILEPIYLMRFCLITAVIINIYTKTLNERVVHMFLWVWRIVSLCFENISKMLNLWSPPADVVSSY